MVSVMSLWPKLLIWIIGIVLALFVLDRLLRWFESKGWIYYRHGPSGGAVSYHLMQMHSVFDPGVEKVIEVKVSEEREEDESGDPFAPGHDGDVADREE
jgi:hypothetical protein